MAQETINQINQSIQPDKQNIPDNSNNLQSGAEGFKAKVISPEDVIPLEKDNKF